MEPTGELEPTGGMEPTGGIRHPLNPLALYFSYDDGVVMVTMGTRWGRFRPNGKWLEGTLFEADPELCLWVSAPRPKNHHRTSRILDMSSER